MQAMIFFHLCPLNGFLRYPFRSVFFLLFFLAKLEVFPSLVDSKHFPYFAAAPQPDLAAYRRYQTSPSSAMYGHSSNAPQFRDPYQQVSPA